MVDLDRGAKAPAPGPRSDGQSRGDEQSRSEGQARSEDQEAGGRSQSGGAFLSDLPDNQYSVLAQTIENQIIPRLMLAHRLDAPVRGSKQADGPGEVSKAVIAFTKLVRTQEMTTLSAHVASLLKSGLSLDSLFLNILAPAARFLGELWHEDECSFVDVTLALCKLQYLLREFGESNLDLEDQHKARFKVLLAAVPGEQHSFGISMVEGFFKRSGWNVRSMPMPGAEEIVHAVRHEKFAVAGLSMSSDAFASKLPGLITKLRKVSRNQSLIVLVGGDYFNQRPDQVLAVGADATASDALHAVARTANAVNGITRN